MERRRVPGRSRWPWWDVRLWNRQLAVRTESWVRDVSRTILTGIHTDLQEVSQNDVFEYVKWNKWRTHAQALPTTGLLGCEALLQQREWGQICCQTGSVQVGMNRQYVAQHCVLGEKSGSKLKKTKHISSFSRSAWGAAWSLHTARCN